MFPAASAPDDAVARRHVRRLDAAQPRWNCSRFRQGCARARRRAAAWLRLCRDRHGDAAYRSSAIPRPRVFRLPRDRAVINRLGFNNGGHAAALARLQRRTGRGVVGVNIGANKDAADRIADYVRGMETFYDVASYFTINISSPNTPGLRDLQDPAALERAAAAPARCARPTDRRRASRSGRSSSSWHPTSPSTRSGPSSCSLRRRASTASPSRTRRCRGAGLSDAEARQAGGLSGRPLFHRSTVMLARVHQATAGQIPLIGIGGIDSGAAALAKIEAGATLVQLYTGLIYEGAGSDPAHQGRRSPPRCAEPGRGRSPASSVVARPSGRQSRSRLRPRRHRAAAAAHPNAATP